MKTWPRGRENKKIVGGYKLKVIISVPLLRLLKENNRVTLLHMSRKTIKEIEADKIILQFYVGYIYSPF